MSGSSAWGAAWARAWGNAWGTTGATQPAAPADRFDWFAPARQPATASPMMLRHSQHLTQLRRHRRR